MANVRSSPIGSLGSADKKNKRLPHAVEIAPERQLLKRRVLLRSHPAYLSGDRGDTSRRTGKLVLAPC
jgi:hypothetical protein